MYVQKNPRTVTHHPPLTCTMNYSSIIGLLVLITVTEVISQGELVIFYQQKLDDTPILNYVISLMKHHIKKVQLPLNALLYNATRLNSS